MARRVIDADVEVHRHLGPGYQESVYENALAVELEQQTGWIGRKNRRDTEDTEGRGDFFVSDLCALRASAVQIPANPARFKLIGALGLRDISFQRQAGFSVGYKGHEVGEGRVDLLVERLVVVELKAADRLTEVHVSQALSYLKATGLVLALLFNFNVPVLMRGVKRVIASRSTIPDEGTTRGSHGERA